MSKYTMQLKNIFNYVDRSTVESWFSSYNLEDYLTTSQIEVITNAGLWTKEKLAKKIVDHYLFSEIRF